MISFLLDSDGNWDVDLVTDIFDCRDVNIILSTPLNNEFHDSWYWIRDKMGGYTVKSAYLLFQNLKNNQNAAPNSGFWRNLWNLKIPSKVKNFL